MGSAESTGERSEAFEQVCQTILQEIAAGQLDREDLEHRKRELCGNYGGTAVPSNGDILQRAPSDLRDQVEPVLRRKPVRTASGVSPVALMTSPASCPHGRCLYCPGGPDSEFESAQSYTGNEPAAARGQQVEYDPYQQVRLRLAQLRHIGHPTDKVELILMGGTLPARSHDYQEWVVKRALRAMNEFDPSEPPTPDEVVSSSPPASFEYLEDVIERNERSRVRNVATTFETKPDWCGPEQIDRMLRLGGTKVELGVQTTFERVNRELNRGHGTDASIRANRRLRDAGFKVGFHMMPGQPGTTPEMAVADMDRLFDRPEWRPDYLKIYPTLVVPGTVIYDWWRRGRFEPLDSDEAAALVARLKERVAPYTRIQRVQRDIPADFIEAGVQKSNLRQLARERLHDRGGSCSCIRCREAGHQDDGHDPENLEMRVRRYEAVGGMEHFISIESASGDTLVGFCRLRFPGAPHRPELESAAVIRDLHVYGQEQPLGTDAESFQHRGFGQRLVDRAETITRDGGYDKIAVISGIGVRGYYREKLGYHQDGPYVSKHLG